LCFFKKNFTPGLIAIEPLNFGVIYKTIIGSNLINAIFIRLFNFNSFKITSRKNQFTPLWYHHLFTYVLEL
jgi:hypothetical protein